MINNKIRNNKSLEEIFLQKYLGESTFKPVYELPSAIRLQHVLVRGIIYFTTITHYLNMTFIY